MILHISSGFRNLRLVAGCTAALLLLSGCLNSCFYYPYQTIYETPGQYSLPYEEVFFKSGDGTNLHGWFIPASGEPIGTVIYFHGNYGNVSYYLKQVQWLPWKRFNVFTFDYRWIIKGCSHLNVFIDRQSGNEYREKLVRFFKDHRL